jgi:4-alpha-glucanotransferase
MPPFMAAWGERPDPLAALTRSLLYLAASPAAVVLVNLADLWLEPEAQNIPGTGMEIPNWRRKLRYSIEEFSQDPQVIKILKEVDRARASSKPGDPT